MLAIDIREERSWTCSEHGVNHVAMEALERFAYQMTTGQTSKILQGTMGCTSLVAANRLQKGSCDYCRRRQDCDVWWKRRWWHTTKRTCGNTVGQAQFTITVPAGMETTGCRPYLACLQLGLHQRFVGALRHQIPPSLAATSATPPVIHSAKAFTADQSKHQHDK